MIKWLIKKIISRLSVLQRPFSSSFELQKNMNSKSQGMTFDSKNRWLFLLQSAFKSVSVLIRKPCSKLSVTDLARFDLFKQKSVIDISITEICPLVYPIFKSEFCLSPSKVSRKTLYPHEALLTPYQPKCLLKSPHWHKEIGWIHCQASGYQRWPQKCLLPLSHSLPFSWHLAMPNEAALTGNYCI